MLLGQLEIEGLLPGEGSVGIRLGGELCSLPFPPDAMMPCGFRESWGFGIDGSAHLLDPRVTRKRSSWGARSSGFSSSPRRGEVRNPKKIELGGAIFRGACPAMSVAGRVEGVSRDSRPDGASCAGGEAWVYYECDALGTKRGEPGTMNPRQRDSRAEWGDIGVKRATIGRLLCGAFLWGTPACIEEPRVVVHEGAALEGYTLVSSRSQTTAELHDMSGEVVHSWDFVGFPAKLLPGGDIVGSLGLPPEWLPQGFNPGGYAPRQPDALPAGRS
ncbi:MAG: hypothetical protein D6795_12650 [Deltaproteobacteria bacterium]|nr:MAG: hypothetical protein D6795_12650 [Deltaproteobacteria bacterium]